LATHADDVRVYGDVGSVIGEVSETSDTSEALLGPGFVYMPTATAGIACGPRKLAGDSLELQLKRAEQALGLDVELAIVLVTHPIGCGNLFYIPIENDIVGIGYAFTNGVEVFDEDLETRLEGLAFLNDFPYWQAQGDEFRTAFLHEVGHRWGARIGARRGDQEFDLTGREGGHWSYFLDTGGSPLEGNQFDSTLPLRTATPPLRLQYSPLDLYLMGLIGPEAVGPIRLLVDGQGEGKDCLGYTVTAASPPQICEPKELSGEWVELTIDDVIAKEGGRSATSEQSSGDMTVGVFVFGSPTVAWSVDDCENVTLAIGERLDDFAAATGQRMRLVNAVGSELSCQELIARCPSSVDEPTNGGCTLSHGRRHPSTPWALALVSLLFVVRNIRRAQSIR
jgi:hypothetical protein